MHEQITNLGWAWHGYCDCPSEKGKKYLKGEYKLLHFYNKMTWKLKIKNRTLSSGTDDNLIEGIKHI